MGGTLLTGTESSRCEWTSSDSSSSTWQKPKVGSSVRADLVVGSWSTSEDTIVFSEWPVLEIGRDHHVWLSAVRANILSYFPTTNLLIITLIIISYSNNFLYPYLLYNMRYFLNQISSFCVLFSSICQGRLWTLSDLRTRQRWASGRQRPFEQIARFFIRLMILFLFSSNYFIVPSTNLPFFVKRKIPDSNSIKFRVRFTNMSWLK